MQSCSLARSLHSIQQQMQDEAATAVVAAASCHSVVIVTAALQHGLSVVVTGEMCLQVLCMLT
jgi:hypothetical protein